jgi:hypothetical protein
MDVDHTWVVPTGKTRTLTRAAPMTHYSSASIRPKSSLGPAFIGLVFGGLLAYLVAEAGQVVYFDTPMAEANKRHMTVAEYEVWRGARVDRTEAWFCALGALVGALVGLVSASGRRGGRPRLPDLGELLPDVADHPGPSARRRGPGSTSG